MIAIVNSIVTRIRELETRIETIEKTIDKLPEGKFICVPNKGYYKWYINKSGNTKYLPKSQGDLAQKLAYKKYLLELKNELSEELKILNRYINKISTPHKSEQMLINSTEMRRLVSPYFLPENNSLIEWINTPYEKNTSYPETLIHKSISGNILRSKSEAMIDMLLFEAKIPYRYESQLVLGNKILWPDFSLLHPRTAERYYWEHFGMMDNSDYANNACQKIKEYTSNGIIPGINLITTFETKDKPLTSDMVKRIIDNYFG